MLRTWTSRDVMIHCFVNFASYHPSTGQAARLDCAGSDDAKLWLSNNLLPRRRDFEGVSKIDTGHMHTRKAAETKKRRAARCSSRMLRDFCVRVNARAPAANIIYCTVAFRVE
jgi:hypothetical protein